MSAVMEEPVTIRKVDWFRVLADLKAAGVSMNQVCLMLGTSTGTVERWKNGSQPLHATGEALLALHAKHCPEKSRSV